MSVCNKQPVQTHEKREAGSQEFRWLLRNLSLIVNYDVYYVYDLRNCKIKSYYTFRQFFRSSTVSQATIVS